MRYKKVNTLLSIVLVILLGCTVVLGYIRFSANEIGLRIGQTKGALVGAAVGSFNGMTEGIEKGIDAGAEDGLSAQDITINMHDSIADMGSLEIMRAIVNVHDIHEVGESYKAVYLYTGDLVFTIDFDEADISISEDGEYVYIRLESPTPRLEINEEETEKVAETYKNSWLVSAEDGIEAYINSVAGMVDRIEERVYNYDSLYAIACDTAISQVETLAKAMTNRPVEVSFK